MKEIGFRGKHGDTGERPRVTGYFRKKCVKLFLIFLCAVRVGAEVEMERGQLIYRLGEKYEIYAYEKKSSDGTMRKYTYVIEGREAGCDIVYLCANERGALSRMTEFLEEVTKTGTVEERVFNVMGMTVYTSVNGAYRSEVLYMNYQEKKVWRVSLSQTLRIYQKEISVFRRQYEYY